MATKCTEEDIRGSQRNLGAKGIKESEADSVVSRSSDWTTLLLNLTEDGPPEINANPLSCGVPGQQAQAPGVTGRTAGGGALDPAGMRRRVTTGGF